MIFKTLLFSFISNRYVVLLIYLYTFLFDERSPKKDNSVGSEVENELLLIGSSFTLDIFVESSIEPGVLKKGVYNPSNFILNLLPFGPG
jgi:hypothetical protein